MHELSIYIYIYKFQNTIKKRIANQNDTTFEWIIIEKAESV